MIGYIFLLFFIEGIISDPTCTKGKNNCLLCNPMTKLCLECDYDVYIPDENGGCEKSSTCNIGYNYCIECDDDNHLCKTCEEGYFPDDNGGCSYSDNCDISYKGRCLKCKEDYILNEEINICKSINLEEFKNCETIQTSNGKCGKCIEGYFLTSGDKKCTKTENCKEAAFEKCTLCNNGFYLDKKEQKCKQQVGKYTYCQEVMDGKTCNVCEKNYYFDKNGNCTSTNFCEKRTDQGTCKECVSGYYFSSSGNTCVKTENCYTGIKSEGICDKCKSGFYIDYKDGKCKSNQEDNDFKECVKVDDGHCIECSLKTYLGDDYKCTDIIYCAESMDGICIECRENYYLGLDNKCSKFEHCIYSTVFDCLECEDNYYFEKSKKVCKEWDDDFYGCKYGYEDKGCERCKNDFYLNKTDKLCYDNSLNDSYYKCAVADENGQCKSCIENYELGNKYHRCSNIKGCVYQESDKKCLECSSINCLDVKTGLCESNTNRTAKQYYKCRKTNKDGTACAVCNEGYTLDDDDFCVLAKNNLF